MKINTQIIKNLNPCDSRFNNYLQHHSDFDGNLKDFLSLDNITYEDKLWVITRLFTKGQNLKFAIMCASSVLHLFEEKYPNDKRPRLALEAAESYLNEPTEENRIKARDAADAARDAAAYAADAARDAADAAYATAYAAAAAYATAYATAATAAADAYAATDAYATAYAAYAAAYESQKELNLIFAVDIESL